MKRLLFALTILAVGASCMQKEEPRELFPIRLNESDLKPQGYYDGALYYVITSTSPREVCISGTGPGRTQVTTPTHVMINDTAYTCIGFYNNAFCGIDSLREVKTTGYVKVFSDSSFMGCSNLTGFVFPKKTSVIGDGAFRDCRQLTSIRFVSGASANIGKGAFEGCVALETVEFKSDIKKIGESAFAGCIGLDSIQTPGGLDTLASKVFAGCIGLKKVVIAKAAYIGDYAFMGCDSLLSIALPKSVTKLGKGAFADCINMDTVALNYGLTLIDSLTFRNCRKLTSITLPSSIDSLETDAFWGCDQLTAIRLNDSIPPSYHGSTTNIGINTSAITLRVPKGSKARYQASPFWSRFTQIVEN